MQIECRRELANRPAGLPKRNARKQSTCINNRLDGTGAILSNVRRKASDKWCPRALPKKERQKTLGSRDLAAQATHHGSVSALDSGKGGPKEKGSCKTYSLVKTMFGPGVTRRFLSLTCSFGLQHLRRHPQLFRWAPRRAPSPTVRQARPDDCRWIGFLGDALQTLCCRKRHAFITVDKQTPQTHQSRARR